MKKHSAWQKDRNRVRRLNREVKVIIRRDDARAEWFNNRFAEMQDRARGLGFMDVWYINSAFPSSQWPPLDDMFIEVSGDSSPSITETGGIPAGLYVVRGISHSGKFDKLLNVQNVNTAAEEFVWFPRRGHRVVSCGEVGDTLAGHHHRGDLDVALETLLVMLLGWPFLVVDLLKPRGRR